MQTDVVTSASQPAPHQLAFRGGRGRRRRDDLGRGGRGGCDCVGQRVVVAVARAERHPAEQLATARDARAMLNGCFVSTSHQHLLG